VFHNNQVMGASASATTTNTAATAPVYVIVGNGFSAVVNHVTLRLSDFGKARLGRAQVIHIYEKNPWFTYFSHDMGQWTDLLTLPGFHFTPPGGTSDRFLASNEFAINTGRELDAVIKSNPSVQMQPGRIEKIERAKDNKFAITLTKVKKPIIADYVDVCSGPGEDRIVEQAKNKKAAFDFTKREILFDKVLLKEYNDPNPVGRVVSAQAYMNGVARRRGGSVCIFGAGALTAGCVEVARRTGCQAIFWVAARRPVNVSFAPGRRYDALARQQDGKQLPWRQGPPPNQELLIPYPKELKFGEGFKVARVSVTGKKRTLSADLSDQQDASDDDKSEDDSVDDQAAKEKLIKIEFALGTPQGRSSRRFVDAANPKAKEPKFIVVDQLVISASSQVDDDEPGSTAFLVKNVRAKEPGGKFLPIKPPAPHARVPGIGQVTFGLQTKDEKFRILGTAALTHRDRMAEEGAGTPPDSRLMLYEKSLPDQARVGLVGITMSAAAVAQCNGFFQKNANDCLNIAHPGELLSVWGTENGNAAYNARRQRIDPFNPEQRSPDDKKYPQPNVGDIIKYYRYGPPGRYW
jgi:hypothetical protein